MNRVSEKQRRRNAEWRKVTRQRAETVQYRCEADIEGVCDGYGAHGHHVIMRSTKHVDTYENCRWVCRSCHRHLHDHLLWAESVGLIDRLLPVPTLPVMFMADPLAWSLAEGIEFRGVIDIRSQPSAPGSLAVTTPPGVPDSPTRQSAESRPGAVPSLSASHPWEQSAGRSARSVPDTPTAHTIEQ